MNIPYILLENFQDIDELVKIIHFQTGHRDKEMAERLEYSRPHLAVILKGPNSDAVNAELLDRLKSKYQSEILQFVSKYKPVGQKKDDYEVTVILKKSQFDRISISLDELDSAFSHARRASKDSRPDVADVPLSGKRK